MKLELLKQKLDYSKPIRGCDLDLDTYNKKFEMWDYVVREGLFDKGDVDAIRLLNDPTIYAYAFLRDDDGQPFRYAAYQDAISDCEHDHTSMNKNRFVIFKAANQIGKSRLLCGEAIRLANVKENINIIMVSKSLPQSQFLLAQIKHTLNNSAFAKSWRDDIGDTANTTTITFEREVEGRIITNRIICAPKGEGLLGYPVHYLFLDEADFYEDAKNFFWKIALPRTNKTKGQIVLFSNPNPDISRNTSLLWELWNSDLFQRKFSFKFMDAPWNSKDEYEMVKKASPSYIFASTHDGRFPEDAGGFFKHKEIQDMLQKDWENKLPNVDRPVYIGLDLAKSQDRTVLVLGTLHKNKEDPEQSDIYIQYMEHFESKTDYDIVIARLKYIIDFYQMSGHGVANIGFDATGVGKAVDDIMKMTGVQSATPIVFSIESKSRMFGKTN